MPPSPSILFRVYIAASLDGFIARPDGSLDWLPSPDPGEDYGYAAFFETVDAMVVGRNTWETVLEFDDNPCANTPIVVLSRSLGAMDIPAPLRDRVSVHPGPPSQVSAHLKERGFRSVYVDGGQTIQSFLRAGLIGEMTITTVPVLLGSGIPLFGTLNLEHRLHLRGTATYASGLVQSVYDLLEGA